MASKPYVVDSAMEQMRERVGAYPLGSPERDAFAQAIVRRGYSEDDARTDAVLMRSWAITLHPRMA